MKLLKYLSFIINGLVVTYPVKWRNAQAISLHTLRSVQFFIHAVIKVNLIIVKGPLSIIAL